MTFIWDDSYSVGNEDIDEQHKMLFDLINKLERDNSDTAVSACLDDLVDYASFHFDEEEDLLEQSNYPDLNSHKDLHLEFRKELEKMVLDFSRGDLAVEILQRYLTNWLIKHIKHTDQKYSSFI